MRGIILARVSTEEQMESGQSIPAQLEKAREYASNKSIIVAEDDEYQFDESSLLDHRKKFDVVLQKIKKSREPIALIVETVDRLQRSFKESVQLDELRKTGKLEIHFIRENLVIHQDSNGSEIQRWVLAVFTAKAYVLSISDNVKRTFERKVRDGQWLGMAYIGYLNERSADDKEGLVVPDPERRHHIVRCYELYATGLESIESVRQKLIKEGFRTRKGNKPSKSQIDRILKNKFYIGIMTIKGKEYPHKYEQLITKGLYDKVQDAIAGRSRQPAKICSDMFVFKAMIRCGHPDCGCRVTPERKKQKYNMYSCTNSKKVHAGRKYINEEDFLKQVYDIFAALRLSDEQVDEITDEVKKSQESKNLYHTNALRGLRQRYDEYQAKIDRLLDLFVDKSITKADYDRKLKMYKEEQYDIGQQIQDHTQADENFYLTATQLINVARNAQVIFDRSEAHEKRQLLNFVFQNFTLSERELSFEVKTPFKSIISCKKADDTKHKTTSVSTDRSMWLPTDKLLEKDRIETERLKKQYPDAKTSDGKSLFDSETISARIVASYELPLLTGGQLATVDGVIVLAEKYGYKSEREMLKTLVQKLWEGNKDKYPTEDSILSEFVKGMIVGNILPMSKLIDRTFGKGTFRKLGEFDGDPEAQLEFVKSL